MYVTNADFKDWRNGPITELVFNTIHNRKIAYSQGMFGGPRDDISSVNWYRGYIQALDDILAMEIDEVNEDA
jgi:hypothetical protein